MSRSRCRAPTLGLLLLGLVAMGGCRIGGSATPTRTPSPSVSPAAAAAPFAAGVPHVRVEDVTAARPQPVPGGRNPFRFQPRGPTVPVVSSPTGEPIERGFEVPAAQRGSAIPLKFIGIVEAPSTAGAVAVLSDGRFVYHGRRDEIIEGRYRIVDIGIESIELELIDGRRRQTLRLSGS